MIPSAAICYWNPFSIWSEAEPEHLTQAQAQGKRKHWLKIFSKADHTDQQDALTFLTVLSFVAWIANAGPNYACPMSTAGHVDALAGGNITLRPFPTTVAHAAAFQVLTISTAKNWTGGCKE